MTRILVISLAVLSVFGKQLVASELGTNSHTVAVAELARGQPCCEVKRSGEGAVVVEPAGHGDVGHGAVTLQQQARRGSEARVRDELAGSETENAFDHAREFRGTQFGTAGETGGRLRFSQVVFQMLHRSGKPGGNVVRVKWRTNVA